MIEGFSVTDEEWWWGEPDYPDTGWVRYPGLEALKNAVNALGKSFTVAAEQMNRSLHQTGRAIDLTQNRVR